MQTITIPKQLVKRGDLVIIPRKEYEILLKIVEKKALDTRLQVALEEYRTGKVYGPFSTVEEGKTFLESRRTRSKRR